MADVSAVEIVIIVVLLVLSFVVLPFVIQVSGEEVVEEQVYFYEEPVNEDNGWLEEIDWNFPAKIYDQEK